MDPSPTFAEDAQEVRGTFPSGCPLKQPLPHPYSPGVKEIDIAATLEHVRDQRPGLVRSKDQFEFALTAVAEEVNAILKALPQ